MEGSCGTFGLDSCPGIDCTKVTGYSAKVAEWNAANAKAGGNSGTSTGTSIPTTQPAKFDAECNAAGGERKAEKDCIVSKRLASPTPIKSNAATYYCCKK